MTETASERILIVDDHQETLNLVSVILKRNGYEVHTAQSGPAGLTLASQILPHLILLDVMMPDMDGYEVCRRIRKHPHLKDVPVIMFTAKSQPGEKWEGFEAGATDYLTKPTNTDELANRVRMILGRTPRRPEIDELAARLSASKLNTPGRTGNTTIMVSPENKAPSGQIIGVLGVRGGTGTTTAAINLAFALGMSKLKTILVDLDLKHGHVGMYLNRQITQSINNLVETAPSYLGEDIQAQLVSYNSELQFLLAQPNLAGQRPPLLPDQAKAIVDELNKRGQQVVLDLGNGVNEVNETVLERADHIILCLRSEKIAVAGAKQILGHLQKIMFPDSHLSVVLLSFGQSIQLPQKAVEQFIGHEVNHTLNINVQEMWQAVNVGQPLILANPQSALAPTLKNMVKALQKAPA